MKIIEPSYTILSNISDGGIKELQFIEQAARTCYKSEDKMSADGESAKKLVKRLIKSGHEAMLEHSSLSVRFVVDRGISHEIVRHRLFSFAQESTRYCNYSKGKFGNEVTFIEPPFFGDGDNYGNYGWWCSTCERAELGYLKLLENGATPQEARTVLPNSTATEIVVTGNYREWRHFFKLRTASDAHPQMREIAVPLLKELKERIPIIFDDIGDDGEKYCINCGAEMIDEQAYRKMRDRGLC